MVEQKTSYSLKLFCLLFISGLFVGLILHGIIEIFTIWILLNFLNNFFLKISWQTWLLIHLLYSIIMEILGVVFTFWVYKKFLWKSNVS
ncbi:hypothetical protein AMJ49_01015 [Parcubacteria bacterium DG_74_2]|nr:MAG: hypothetical protein AMJ49_01015 [Parcubacteria bacterium DG_74_2]